MFHGELSKTTSVNKITGTEEPEYGKHKIHFSIAILTGVFIYYIEKGVIRITSA
jgi:hypothetical protein